MTCKEIEDAFAEGGKVESIEPTRFEVRPDSNDISFGDGGPKAWFALVGEGLMWKAKSQTTQAV